ncbi:ABC transporter ATP-binding protein [soil metagenome]
MAALEDRVAGTATPVAEPALEVRGVKAAYGKIEVLHGVDLVVPPGSVVALLGANGAGKTTTLGVASGQIAPTEGDVFVAGRRITGASASALAAAGLCTVPEGRGIFRTLTVRENLRMATYRGLKLPDIEDRAYEIFPKLGERRGQVAGTLSGGEQQMLSLARALVTDPSVLMLDELSMGLAPMIVDDLYQQVAGIAQRGVSVLIVEQFARTVLGVADVAAIMAHGRITSVGTPADIETQLSDTYLGANQ